MTATRSLPEESSYCGRRVIIRTMGSEPPSLTIVDPNGVHAKAMWIRGIDQIRALRDACNEALSEEVGP